MTRVIGYVMVTRNGNVTGVGPAPREMQERFVVESNESCGDTVRKMFGPFRVAELREITPCVWARRNAYFVSSCSTREHEVVSVDVSNVRYCYHCGAPVEVAE